MAAFAWYGQGLKNLALGNVNWDSSTDTDYKVMLCTSAYVPDPDHEFRSSVANEVTGTGYTAGGANLTAAARSVYYDTTSNEARLCITGNVVWSASTITARRAVIYKNTGNAATDLLVGYCNFDSDVSSTNGDFTIDFPDGSANAATLKIVAG